MTGRVDVLVHNARIEGKYGANAELGAAEVDETLDINVRRTAREGQPSLRAGVVEQRRPVRRLRPRASPAGPATPPRGP